jgi:hypothetical protein
MISHSKLPQESPCASKPTSSRCTKARQTPNLRIIRLAAGGDHQVSNTTIPPTSIPLSENSPAFHVQVQSQQANVDLSHSNSHADLHDTVSANNIKAHCLVRSNAAADTEKMSACGVTVPNQIQATQLHGRLQCDASELCPSKPSPVSSRTPKVSPPSRTIYDRECNFAWLSQFPASWSIPRQI